MIVSTDDAAAADAAAPAAAAPVAAPDAAPDAAAADWFPLGFRVMALVIGANSWLLGVNGGPIFEAASMPFKDSTCELFGEG